MNRRQFLKALGITLAATQIPISSIADAFDYPHFNPKLQYGDYVAVTDFLSDAVIAECVRILDEDSISKAIPPRYRHKIIYFVERPKSPKENQYPFPDHQYRTGFVGWRYN